MSETNADGGMSDQVNNGPQNPANAGGGESPTLDQMYDTLGSVTAGSDARQKETDEENGKIEEQVTQLIAEREQAAQAGDFERSDELSRQLDELHEAWLVNHMDEEPADAGTDQHQDRAGEQPSDERDGDGDSDPGPAG